MMNYKGWEIPEGNVVKVTDENGKVLWVLNTNKPVYLQVKTMISNTYVSSTSYTGEEFIRLKVYVKPEGTVNVTYGGVTKTVTNTSTTADSVSDVVFGTYGGVSYGAVPSSGELVIEGDCVAFAESSFNTAKSTTVSTSCVVSIKDSGSITSVPASAFTSNLNLTSAVFGKSVKNISDMAFSGCTNLSNVQLNENLETLGIQAFYNCTSLKGVQLGNKLETINARSFYGCTSLSSVQIGENIKTIDDLAFYGCTSLPRIHIPANVESILGSSFMGCSSLSNISIDSNNGVYYTPDGRAIITKNGKVLICVPTASGNYTVPSEVVEIGEYVFYSNTALTGVNLPSGLTTIGSSAFQSSGLTSVTLPSRLTTIGSNAFSNVPIKSISIPASVHTVGARAFGNTDLTGGFTVPSTVKSWGAGVFADTNLTSVVVPQGATISTRMFKGCTSLTSISIAAGITEIPSGFCEGCYNLSSISLPEGLVTIRSDAFHAGTSKASQLASITIPSTVTSIEAGAFYGIATSVNRVIYMLPTTPPTLGGSTALGINGASFTTAIYVPRGCGEAYKNGTGWSKLVDKIVEM